MPTKLAAALALCALALPAAASEGAPPPEKPKPVLSVGDTAPAFFLRTVNAKTVGKMRIVLEDYFKDPATKGVMISFFATWCAPCKKELPVLQKLWTKYGEKSLRIVTISIDKEDEAVKGLEGFITELGLTYPVVSDRFNLLARRYLGAATALPSLFVTDGEGKIVSIHQSYEEDAEAMMEREVKALLGVEG